MLCVGTGVRHPWGSPDHGPEDSTSNSDDNESGEESSGEEDDYEDGDYDDNDHGEEVGEEEGGEEEGEETHENTGMTTMPALPQATQQAGYIALLDALLVCLRDKSSFTRLLKLGLKSEWLDLKSFASRNLLKTVADTFACEIERIHENAGWAGVTQQAQLLGLILLPKQT